MIPNHSFSIDFNIIVANLESYKDTFLYKKSQELGKDSLAEKLALAVAYVINYEILGFEVAKVDTGCLEVTLPTLKLDNQIAYNASEIKEYILNWLNTGNITSN